MERRLIMNWAMRAWRPCNRCCIAIVLHFGLDGVVDLASLMFDGDAPGGPCVSAAARILQALRFCPNRFRDGLASSYPRQAR